VKKLDKHELTKMYSEVEQALKLTEGVKRRYFPAEEETETTMQIEEDLNEAMQILDNVLTNIDEMIRYQNN
jgi:septation ring formation regulator EzrA